MIQGVDSQSQLPQVCMWLMQTSSIYDCDEQLEDLKPGKRKGRLRQECTLLMSVVSARGHPVKTKMGVGQHTHGC